MNSEIWGNKSKAFLLAGGEPEGPVVDSDGEHVGGRHASDGD
ncbi:MAG: hypothetical protein ACYDGN_09820 [Acidimicrobiales bacterium]